MKSTLAKTLAIAVLAAGLLTACASPAPDTLGGAPRPTTDRYAGLIKDTSVCFFSLIRTGTLNLFVGSKQYPEVWYLAPDFSYPGGRGGPVNLTDKNNWVCTNSINKSTFDLPGEIDVSVQVTFPNGRATTLGFTNPLLEAPIFYPANDCYSQGPCSDQEYKIPEGKTYLCSLDFYDFKVKREQDDANFKVWSVEFVGPTPDSEHWTEQICVEA